MIKKPNLTRYRLIVESDAARFRDVDDLLITIEAALDAARRHGETAAVWLEPEIASSAARLATDPMPIDPDYMRKRRLEEDLDDVD